MSGLLVILSLFPGWEEVSLRGRRATFLSRRPLSSNPGVKSVILHPGYVPLVVCMPGMYRACTGREAYIQGGREGVPMVGR